MSLLSSVFPALLAWLPVRHYTTYIRWLKRVGLGLLMDVQVFSREFAIMVDHTVQFGSKKALVVLRLPLDIMTSGTPITLKDLDVVIIDVRDSWNGMMVTKVMRQLFAKIGYPTQIISDHGPDLFKGLKDLVSFHDNSIHMTYDITHFIANMIKARFQDDTTYKEFRKAIQTVRLSLQMTDMAFLIPPSLRTKGREIQTYQLFKWAVSATEFLERELMSADSMLSASQQLRVSEAFEWFCDNPEFVAGLAHDLSLLAQVQKVVKTAGLSQESYSEVRPLLREIKETEFRSKLGAHFESEIFFANRFDHPIVQTSDPEESLFGKFKQVAALHGKSEVGDSSLLMPVICRQDPIQISKAFGNSSMKKLEKWRRETIGVTQAQQRNQAFPKKKSGKPLVNKTYTGQEVVGGMMLMN